jgi:GAF domain-containing protein
MATREEVLAATFLQLADTLVDDFDVVEILTMLSDRCVELLDAAATGIMIADGRGDLKVMAASSEDAKLLELFQTQNQEGPCLDAFRWGVPVVHADLAAGSPWPRFAALAMGAALPSVHAFPMRVRDYVLGTLNLFMGTPGPLSDADIAVAQALADAATLALLQNAAAQDGQRLIAQLQGALNSRIAIEQAKGAIAERANISTDKAFSRLRGYARDHNIKLTDVATAVVARTLPVEALAALTQPTPQGLSEKADEAPSMGGI